MSPSAVVDVLELLAQKSFNGVERKELYNAALKLAWSLESEQDTAQRLYHGVGQYADILSAGQTIDE